MREFMPHQEQAFLAVKDRDTAALFMEMRLGKTLVAIRWAKLRNATEQIYDGRPKRNLVLGPNSVLDSWEEELTYEGWPSKAIVWLSGLDARKRIATVSTFPNYPECWYLLNYEAVRVWPGIGLVPWDVVILDESTRIKNPKAKTTKTILKQLIHVRNRLILSGLPAPESAMDYFCQGQFVNDGRFLGFTNFWSFRDALFKPYGYDWVPRKGTRERIKKAVNEFAFVMTRKQAGVGSTVVQEKRVVEMNAEQKRVWKQITEDFKYNDKETKSAGAQHIWMQRVAGGFSPDRDNPELISDTKVRELLSLLEGELKNEQVLVFFHFNEELAYVYHLLKSRGISTTAILGATPIPKRMSRRRRFQKGEFRVVCSQLETVKMGLDFSAADTEIFYSNAWALQTREQAQDRIVHPKKKTPLLAIDLVTRDSTDEDVIDTLRDKRVDARSFMTALRTRIQERFSGKQSIA